MLSSCHKCKPLVHGYGFLLLGEQRSPPAHRHSLGPILAMCYNCIRGWVRLRLSLLPLLSLYPQMCKVCLSDCMNYTNIDYFEKRMPMQRGSLFANLFSVQQGGCRRREQLSSFNSFSCWHQILNIFTNLLQQLDYSFLNYASVYLIFVDIIVGGLLWTCQLVMFVFFVHIREGTRQRELKICSFARAE